MHDEKLIEVSRELETHHAIFYKLWEMGKPRLTKEIATAAVAWNREGELIDFIFNEDLWNNSDAYKRAFIIAHECLHVLLNHGSRIVDTKNNQMANIALDIVVNHTLVERFGFDRSKIEGAEEYCWIDTIFPGEKEIPTNECFEYYFNLLKNQGGTLRLTLDDHQSLSDPSLSDSAQDETKKLNHEDLESLNRGVGNQPGNIVETLREVPRIIKRKWETVIKQWTQKRVKCDLIDKEQWTRLNRRLFALQSSLMLPSEMEADEHGQDNGRIPVWFFLDTSGSCYNLKNRFFKAANSMPQERFDIRLFCFDTRVYETSLESRKVYGFGGTSFSIISNYIERRVEAGETYPDAVFVLTDGYSSTEITPRFPTRWHWFLTTTNTHSIPKKCNIHKLSDYE